MDPRGKSEFLNALVLTVSNLRKKKIQKDKSTYQKILVLQAPSLLLKANVALNLEWKIPSTRYKKFTENCYHLLCSLANMAWHMSLKQFKLAQAWFYGRYYLRWKSISQLKFYWIHLNDYCHRRHASGDLPEHWKTKAHVKPSSDGIKNKTKFSNTEWSHSCTQ